MYNEKVFFLKTEYLVKTVKKCFLKKLSIWLILIKVAIWVVNYQKKKIMYIQSIVKILSKKNFQSF